MTANDFICGACIVLIFVAAFVYVLKCRKKLLALNAEIERILKAKDVAAALKKSKLLAPARAAFEKSLTRTNDEVFSAADAAEFFSVQTLTQGLNMSFWQAYGGIFTGLGILGTFAGLTFGLYGVDMTSGDIGTLKNSIAELLSGVKTAFITSLVGIAGGLVYSLAHHRLLVRLGENVQRLTNNLDEIYPRRNVEDWLAEKFLEAKHQTATLQSIDIEAKDQSVALKNIGEQVRAAIHNALDEKLDDYVKAICTAIEHLGADGADKLGEIFTKGVGSQMDRFSAALDRFSGGIDEKLKTADEFSKIMNDRLLTTLQELTDKLNQTATADATRRNADYEKFSSTLESLIKTMNGNAAGNVAQINQAVKTFREIVDRHNDATKKTFDQIQTLLSDTESLLEIMNEASLSFKTAADPVKQSTQLLTKNLNATAAQMNRLAEANQTTSDNIAVLSTRLVTFVQNFKGIANELERATETITDSLDNYNAKTSTQLSKTLTDFATTVDNAYSGLNEIVNDLLEALNDFKNRGR